jgi:hypothetical protein
LEQSARARVACPLARREDGTMEEEGSIGCGACFGGSAGEAAAAIGGLRMDARLVDESHFSVSLRACAGCGQRFVQLFSERVDWVNGEDPQTIVVIPITPGESERLRGRGDVTEDELAALATGRRRLEIDHPSDGPRTVEWRSGPLVIPPHD